jgi:hypothetical protein
MFRLPVTLLLSLSLFAQTDPNSQQPGQIAGHVQSAVTGEPVSGAQVQLIQFGPIAKWPAAGPHNVSSQPDGSFVIDNVPPGLYSLTATAANYSTGRYKTSGSPSPMDSLTVQSGAQVAGIVLALQPLANLIGKVVDDSGAPIPHAQVQAFVSVLLRGKTILQPRVTATADDAGQFQLKGIPNGKIYISAAPAPSGQATNPPSSSNPAASKEPKLDLVSTFYPDSLDLSGAVPIEVRSGQDLGETDIHMKRASTFHIRGKVAVTAAPGARLEIEVSPRGSVSYPPSQGATPGPDGQFDISGLVPGAYTLRVISASANRAGPSPSQRVFSRQDVTIAAADVNGVVLSQTPPVTLTWHARSDSDESANLSGVIISLASWDDQPPTAVPVLGVNPDGSHAITVDPGLYLIHVAGVPPGSYVSSLQLNQTDALNKVVDLSQGGAGQVDIVFRKGLAELDGSLSTSQDAAPRAATIILVPELLAPDGSNLMMRGTGRSAAFSFNNVPPGRYTAFAVEQFNYNVWQNPNFIASLQGRGTAVDLGENDRKRIELTVVSTTDLQQTMAQLGLGE